MSADFGAFLEDARRAKRAIILDGATGSEIKRLNPKIAQDETWSGLTHIKRDEGGNELSADEFVTS
jgi:hypothetical protein